MRPDFEIDGHHLMKAKWGDKTCSFLFRADRAGATLPVRITPRRPDRDRDPGRVSGGYPRPHRLRNRLLLLGIPELSPG